MVNPQVDRCDDARCRPMPYWPGTRIHVFPAPRIGAGPVFIASLLLAGVGLGGCGYDHEPLYPEDVSTVAVNIFGNRSFYRGAEFSLTEAIVKQIEWRTPYKVVDRSRADTIISGKITEITQRSLSRRRQGGLPQDVEYRMVVDFQWKDLRSGQVLRKRDGMEIVAPFAPAVQVGEQLSMGQDRAVQRVAETVVSVMKADL